MILKKTHLLLGLIALVNVGAGAAVPNVETDAEASAVNAIAKREVNGANCWKYKDPWNLMAYYAIKTWGNWDENWGKALLDNLKGTCVGKFGDVKNWGFHCEQGPPPTDGFATFNFNMVGVYWDHCVLDAVWRASNGAGQSIEGATCWESDYWWGPK